MPKNICLFQASWLEDERFKHWIMKKRHCCNMQLCSKDVSVASMEEAALALHMKGKKHIESSPSDQCIKSLRPPASAPHLSILKISLSGVWSFR